MKCVWVSAWEGSRRMPLWRDHILHVEPPVDWRLQGTSSWENLVTGRDRHVPSGWSGQRPGDWDPGRDTGSPMTERHPSSHLHRLLLAGEFVVTAEMQTSDSADPSARHRARGHVAGQGRRRQLHRQQRRACAHRPMAAARLLLDQGVEPLDAAGLPGPEPARPAGRSARRGRARGPQHRVHDRRRREHGRSSGDQADLRHRLGPPDPDGKDHAGRRDLPVRAAALPHAPDYLIGAVENPFAPPLEFRPMRLGTKIEAGAEFVQTQICFNLEKMRLFMARCGELGLLDHVWVLAGVFVPSSAAGARYLRDQVPGSTCRTT